MVVPKPTPNTIALMFQKIDLVAKMAMPAEIAKQPSSKAWKLSLLSIAVFLANHVATLIYVRRIVALTFWAISYQRKGIHMD